MYALCACKAQLNRLGVCRREQVATSGRVVTDLSVSASGDLVCAAGPTCISVLTWKHTTTALKPTADTKLAETKGFLLRRSDRPLLVVPSLSPHPRMVCLAAGTSPSRSPWLANYN
jgi:hypothetical protein